MHRFNNHTVLVTGGSSGIGLAAAKAYAHEGARVVITGRDEQALARAQADIGHGAMAVRNDAGSIEEARRLAASLQAQDIQLDAIFINAGVARVAPLAEVSEARWDDTFNANVKGPYFQIQALSPLLRQGAAIVINGSINPRDVRLPDDRGDSYTLAWDSAWKKPRVTLPVYAAGAMTNLEALSIRLYLSSRVS